MDSHAGLGYWSFCPADWLLSLDFLELEDGNSSPKSFLSWELNKKVWSVMYWLNLPPVTYKCLNDFQLSQSVKPVVSMRRTKGASCRLDWSSVDTNCRQRCRTALPHHRPENVDIPIPYPTSLSEIFCTYLFPTPMTALKCVQFFGVLCHF